MKIHTGDTVVIRTGKDRGKTGKVLRVLENSVVVEGINIMKKHVRARSAGQSGGIVDKPMPINVSNVSLANPKTGKAARVGYDVKGGKKTRVIRSKGETINIK